MSIWLVAVVLGAYGTYGAWASAAIRHWAPGVMGLLALVAAAGLLLGKPWSRFCVYLLALLAAAGWGYAVWIFARAGWPFPDVTSSVMALVPGALLVAAFAGSSVVAYRYFRGSSE